MVLNTDLKEIMMDHALRTISYIADIGSFIWDDCPSHLTFPYSGDLVVLMARRRFVPHEMEDAPKINRTPKMICHVFESEEAQFIAQSIGQAFQVSAWSLCGYLIVFSHNIVIYSSAAILSKLFVQTVGGLFAILHRIYKCPAGGSTCLVLKIELFWLITAYVGYCIKR